MTTEPTLDSATGSGSGAETESAAQKLLAKHAADEIHNPTVEDVPDEEDLAHATPSATAKGKQKADDSAPVSKAKGPALDVTSNEAFPALGGPKAAAPAASTWGKKPAGVNGSPNGVNGAPRTPTHAAPVSRPGAPISMPGKHNETINVENRFFLPRNQMKKPLAETLRDFNKRSKAKVTMKDFPNGKIFDAQAPTKEAAVQALKEIMQQVGAKVNIKVPVPVSVRSHIIGRQGATIQDISKKTGARVQMPKQDDLPPQEDDEDATIDVSVEGDWFASGYAQKMIEQIVNERTSTANLRLKDIPAEFYPFIAGPNNSRIPQFEKHGDIKVNVPHYHTYRDAAPPQASASGPLQFAPQPSLPIQISGDRQAAQQARQEIDAFVNSLRRQLQTDSTIVDKGRHSFIAAGGKDVEGKPKYSAHDFHAETGCALVKPPPGADDEYIYVVGPADRLPRAIERLEELASELHTVSVDAAKPHMNARNGGQEHARNLTRYIQQRKAMEEIERQHGANVIFPASGDGQWSVLAGNYQGASKARNEITKVVSALPPSRFGTAQVDPFFHQTLRQREAPRLRKEHGVHILFPDGHMETADLLLVYEQPGSPSEYVIPRQAPSSAEVKAHEQAIRQVQKELQELVALQQQIESRQLDAHPRFHDKIRRYVDKEQQGLGQDQFPVQLQFVPSGRTAAQRPPNSFSIRGPSSAVDDLNAKLLAFVEQEIKDEAERGFKTSFEYPQKFANHLIGKRGENINRLREEFDVDIQVKEGKVELTGPEKKCAACKSHILNNLKKLEDETTHTIKVKPQYHRDLIGPKGAQVNRLQDRYGVRVNFPRNAPANDDASDIGSVKNFRNQNPDEVVIKGPKRGADEARDELLSLLQYVVDNGNIATLSVQQSQIPSLIGSGGRAMEELRLQTGCQIDIPNAKDGADDNGRVEVKLRGTKTAVEAAKKLLQERVKTFDDTVTKSVNVDKKHHKNLIGAGGSNIRKIVVDSGGPDDARQIAKIVRFPRPGDEDNTIRVEGSKALVDKIVATIESQAKSRDDLVTDHLDVAADKHRLLIGRGGETRRNLEQKLNVQLDVPRQGSDETQVKFTGLPSDVEKAKKHIEELTKEQQGETIQVPRKFHHAISDNGRIFRQMRDHHGVTVDHAGSKPPPRPTTAGAARARNVNGGASMPLITDDATDSADAHSWELVDNTVSGEDLEGEISWILRGSDADKIAKARSQIQSALDKASKPSWTGYLILPDAKSYGRIIGPGGSQINSIKKTTGCDVQVPRGQRDGEAVSITGEKGGVEQARDIILGIVKDAANGMGARGGGRRGGQRDEY